MSDKGATATPTPPTPPKRRVGRPSKLTPERKKKLLDGLAANLYFVTACRNAGVSYDAFNEWMLKGEDPKGRPEYRQFRQDVEAAVAQGEAVLVARWMQAATGIRNPDGTIVRAQDWRAARDLLARRYKDRWAPVYQVTGKDGGPIKEEIVGGATIVLQHNIPRPTRPSDEGAGDAGGADEATERAADGVAPGATAGDPGAAG